MIKLLWLCVCLAACASAPGSAAPAPGKQTLVHTPAEYRAAVQSLQPGDTIVLADGVWRDFEILFEGQGTAKAPLTLTAQTPGNVIISGLSNLRLAGRYLVVRGLVFRNGYTPTGEVIAFRRDTRNMATDSRVTETVIDHFNRLDRAETDLWVAIFGRGNRFDHNEIVGKLNAGVTVAVRLDAPDSNANHHRIDHNYFGPRPPLGSNGGETIRIGTSANSLEDSNTVVEDNYFEATSGEVEIVSVKSGANVVRNNVFVRAQGSVVLRHGSGNLVENNAFFGDGVDNTGGVRVINSNQIVRNNWFVGLRGTGFAGALVVMNGVPNSPINRYHQVRNAVIENNSFIDVATISFGAGADTERSLPPAASIFRRNLVVGGPAKLFRLDADTSGIAFSDNLVSRSAAPAGLEGFTAADLAVPLPLIVGSLPKLIAPAGVGAAAFKLISRREVGPRWSGKVVAPAVGTTIRVQPGIDTISAAVARAHAGDVLVLEPGNYHQKRPIDITRPLTLRGQRLAGSEARPLVTFESAVLFSLAGQGELQLQHLGFSGAGAPDAAGNSVIRATGTRPPANFKLSIVDCEFKDMNVNRGFAVVRSEAKSFIEHLLISGSSFNNISGPVLSLRGESEAFGIYNIESMQITDSKFVNIGAPAFDVLRSGTDESTFGPRLVLRDTLFERVGGAQGAAVLQGVQLLDASGNHLVDSRPMQFIIEVGEPRLAGSDIQQLLTIVDRRPGRGA